VTKLTQEIMEQADAQGEIVNNHRHLFDYAGKGAKALAKKGTCKHDEGISSSIWDALWDGDEMVATLDVCAACGRLMPPCRVSKDSGGSVLALGKHATTFKELTKLLK